MKLTERIKNVGNYALGTLKNPITYSVLLSSLYGCGEFKKESRDTYCDSTKSELFKGNPQDSIRTFKKFHSPTIDTIWTNQYNWSIRRIEYESSGRRTETIDDMRDWRDGKGPIWGSRQTYTFDSLGRWIRYTADASPEDGRPMYIKEYTHNPDGTSTARYDFDGDGIVDQEETE